MMRADCGVRIGYAFDTSASYLLVRFSRDVYYYWLKAVSTYPLTEVDCVALQVYEGIFSRGFSTLQLSGKRTMRAPGFLGGGSV